MFSFCQTSTTQLILQSLWFVSGVCGISVKGFSLFSASSLSHCSLALGFKGQIKVMQYCEHESSQLVSCTRVAREMCYMTV